ncbi:MAG: undecaprenol kinase [Candidatus Paraimprobicoccus trichonymphae]|uniref:Undecaprenol kinase n=1 Tax=Candidatus Paraimprobicoccus trichonymphae TaxID=3033793 RepID=A0AA48KZL7_9FIRM|nr:MAG: undecaprenol kinase [Candidatus Paraimprobicoccus trichonymphae]
MRGLKYCIINEKNMRIHSVITVYMLVFSTFFNLNKLECLILILTIALVLISEIINTSTEAILDKIAFEYNSSAKIIKDIAAGAVLLSAAAAVVVGVIIFNDFEIYLSIFNFFKNSIFLSLVFMASLVFNWYYIFWGPKEILNKIKSRRKI